MLARSARLRRERLSSVAAAAHSLLAVGGCSVHHTPLVSIDEEQHHLLCLHHPNDKCPIFTPPPPLGHQSLAAPSER